MNFLKTNKIKYFNRLVYITGLFTLYNYTKNTPNNLKSIFARKRTLKLLNEKYGEGWVVISGATSGAGLSFARELSNLGYNTLLISRDEEKLNKTSRELHREYGTLSRSVVFDYSQINDVTIEELKEKINKTIGDDKISILINNVGIQLVNDNKFENLSAKDLINYVNINVLSQMAMYNIFLKRLKSQQSRSIIIDVSSSLSDIDVMPVNAVYQSTKTFNARFSQIMNQQLEIENKLNGTQRNVDIVTFKPGMFVSNLTERHQTKLFMSDYADNVVVNCLFDVANGEQETRGTFKHKFMHFLVRNIPKYIKDNYISTKIYEEYNIKQ
jgi:short-subunit dehydrogenase